MKSQALSGEQDRLVKMLRALGSPARFKILCHLVESPECIVSDVVKRTPLAQSTVSQHLRVLREAGLICGEIEGPATNYCLDRGALNWLIHQLRQLGEHPGNEVASFRCCEPPPFSAGCE